MFFFDNLTVEDGTDSLPRKVALTSQKSEGLSYNAVEAWNLANDKKTEKTPG